MIKNQDQNYLYKVEKRTGYNIFLMNTAFTAGTDDDEGKLILEKNLFYDEIKKLKVKEKSVNIAIGHHPIKSLFRGKSRKNMEQF